MVKRAAIVAQKGMLKYPRSGNNQVQVTKNKRLKSFCQKPDHRGDTNNNFQGGGAAIKIDEPTIQSVDAESS